MLSSLCTWWTNSAVYDNNLPHSLAPVIAIALSCIKIPRKCMSIDTTMISESIFVLTERDSSSGHPQSAVQLYLIGEPLWWAKRSCWSESLRKPLAGLIALPDISPNSAHFMGLTDSRGDNRPLRCALSILRICGHYAVAQLYELINNALQWTYNWSIIFISSNLLLRLSQETISWTRWFFLAPASSVVAGKYLFVAKNIVVSSLAFC